MNTSSIKEIHEHLKHQTHKSTLNPKNPKHRANNPFVNLIVGTDLVHPKFRSQPRLLARPNLTTGASIRERKREREPAISELGATSQAVDRFASIAARIHLQPILVSLSFWFLKPIRLSRRTNPLFIILVSQSPLFRFFFSPSSNRACETLAAPPPSPLLSGFICFFFFFLLFSFI